MKRYNKYNPKRKIRVCTTQDREYLSRLCAIVGYGGNPQHKKNPGDFGLKPPCDPRPTKSLCDTVSVFRKEAALELLREGVRRGLVSESERNGFPQNIWSVIELRDGNAVPLESQLENPEKGTYHGYPLPETDPMHGLVLERWRTAQCLISK